MCVPIYKAKIANKIEKQNRKKKIEKKTEMQNTKRKNLYNRARCCSAFGAPRLRPWIVRWLLAALAMLCVRTEDLLLATLLLLRVRATCPAEWFWYLIASLIGRALIAPHRVKLSCGSELKCDSLLCFVCCATWSSWLRRCEACTCNCWKLCLRGSSGLRFSPWPWRWGLLWRCRTVWFGRGLSWNLRCVDVCVETVFWLLCCLGVGASMCSLASLGSGTVPFTHVWTGIYGRLQISFTRAAAFANRVWKKKKYIFRTDNDNYDCSAEKNEKVVVRLTIVRFLLPIEATRLQHISNFGYIFNFI